MTEQPERALTQPEDDQQPTSQRRRRRTGGARRVPWRRFRTTPAVGRPGALRKPTLRPLKDLALPHAFQHVAYRRYWIAQFISLAGTWMQSVGMQLVVLSLTTSAFAIGLINIVQAIPLLFFSLSGGVLADKFDRRRIMIVTLTLGGIISLIYAMLAGFGWIQYWHILLLAAITGTVVSFELPASQAFVSELVPADDLPQAIALNSASFNSTRIVGPAIAAAAIGALGVASAFILNALSLIAPAITLVGLGKILPKHTRKVGSSGGLAAMKDGFAYVRTNEGLMGLILLQAAISFFVSPNVLVLLPLYITDGLGGGDAWVGYALSTLGVGSLIGALVLLRGSRLESAAMRRLMIANAGLCIGMGWIALSTHPLMALPGIAITGYSFSGGNSQISTTLQSTAPDELRGRVMSLSGLAFNGVMPFATLLISALSGLLGQHIVMFGSAVLLACCHVYLWKRYVHKAYVREPIQIDGAQHAL